MLINYILIPRLTSGETEGSARSMPFTFWGDDLRLRNELMPRSGPISLLRLEGLSLVGDRGCAFEYVEDAYVLVEPKSSRSGVSLSFSLCIGVKLLARAFGEQPRIAYKEEPPSQNGLSPEILRFALLVRRLRLLVLIA
jgi:hypothetical protein